jgi:L-ribulokinase
MMAAGAFSSVEEAQKKMCLPNKTYAPDPAAAAVYGTLYELYRKTYFALGTLTAASCSLGDVLPELRKIARRVTASS